LEKVSFAKHIWDGLSRAELTVEVSRLDLAAELRLRRWARLNYVPVNRRSESWHPIVLAEMRCQDEELAAFAPPPHAGMRYVPLAPHVLPTPPGDLRVDQV
jgi:hypothetical protein